MAYFVDALKNHYGDFSGKATRREYWMFVLCYLVIYFVARIVDGMIPAMDGAPVLTGLLALACFIPNTSITCRRLHDVGRSGWWMLIAIVPLGIFVLLAFLVQGSYTPEASGLDLRNEEGLTRE